MLTLQFNETAIEIDQTSFDNYDDCMNYLQSIFPSEYCVEGYTDEIHVFHIDDEDMNDPVASFSA